jgi:hypothetical protein
MNFGVTHKATSGMAAKHSTGANYDCEDCHALEASTGSYVHVRGRGLERGG